MTIPLIPPTAEYKWPLLPLDLAKWDACWQLLIDEGMHYVWDGKAVPLSSSPPTFFAFGSPCHGCDCSGAMRWAVYHATHGQVDIDDGSYTQGEFLAGCGLKQTDPANCALHDGRLRICVHHPDGLDGTGHVWATRNGVTCESYGGRGPGHRPWDTRLSSGHTLNQLATLCLVAT